MSGSPLAGAALLLNSYALAVADAAAAWEASGGDVLKALELRKALRPYVEYCKVFDTMREQLAEVL